MRRVAPLVLSAFATAFPACVFWDMSSWSGGSATFDGGADTAASDVLAAADGADARRTTTCEAHGGTVYYVAPSGNNANVGSLAAPFRSLIKGVSVLHPGDTLCVRAGTYAEQVIVTTAGTENAPIVLSGYPGERPVIDPGVPTGSNAIAVWSSPAGGEVGWIQIRGFELRGAEMGVHFTEAHHLTLEDNDCHATNVGIYGDGHDNVIVANVLHDGQGKGLSIDGRRYLVANNVIYANGGGGLQIAAYGCQGCVNPDGRGGVDLVIANNVFAFHASGPDLNVWLPSGGTDLRNVTMANNAFFSNGQGSSIALQFEVDGGAGVDLTTVTVQNSIFSGTSGIEGSKIVRLNNLLSSDPRFVDPQNHDFHLQPGSPARGAGANLSSLGRAELQADIDGNPRPASSAWDVGVYQMP